MERLKVLFITAWYPTKEQPVGGVFVREHAKAVQLYDDVVVLHCAGPDPNLRRLWRMQQETDEDFTSGISTYRVWYRRIKTKKISYFVYVWSVYRAFRRIVSAGLRPHVIHAQSYDAGLPAILIGKLYRIPVIVTEHSTEFPRKLLGRSGPHIARLVFENIEVAITVSKSLQRAIEAYGIKADFQVIPNAVDTDLFNPGSFLKSENHLKRLLFVGLLHLSHKKGVPYLLNALVLVRERRDDWFLDIVGDGPARDEYERMAARLGLGDKVTFHGLKTKEEVAEFMRKADIFVLPSIFETFAVVAAEALATGLPVLATHCGGPEEFIIDEVGKIVPPGDAEALCKGLNDMLSNLKRFKRAEISSYAADHFSHRNIGAELHSVYNNLIRSESDSFEVGLTGERIAIDKHWRVLDIGSGHNPHRRANVLLDKNVHSNIERSGKPALRDIRPFVIGDAERLPFKDQSFDYVIASHIAEHTRNPIAFYEEIQRVAPRGYIECPGPLSELLLGEPFHLWIVEKKGKTLEFRKNTRNSRLWQLSSGIFYALFYVNENRARWTFKPKIKAIRFIFSTLSWLTSKCWRSRILRRWTYTCFQFNENSNVKILS
ncbi:MAG: glycosyltransferase [Syntrophobacterales bacterium]|jgi:glycosyltransferase involved in cell wall biosynthesis